MACLQGLVPTSELKLPTPHPAIMPTLDVPSSRNTIVAYRATWPPWQGLGGSGDGRSTSGRATAGLVNQPPTLHTAGNSRPGYQKHGSDRPHANQGNGHGLLPSKKSGRERREGNEETKKE